MTDAPSPSTLRVTSLDAIRGCACLAVAACHVSSAAPLATIEAVMGTFWVPLVRFFTNGDAAVIIFFLLSGYVLAMPFFREEQPGYGRFLFKRICRLYIPFAIAITLAWHCFRIIDASIIIPDAGPWLTEHEVGLRHFSLIGHFLVLGRTEDMNLDTPIWTLVHEMRISILFPLLLILSRDTRKTILAALAFLLTSIGLLNFCGATDPWGPVNNFGVSLLWTLRMIPYFLVGILLCKHADAIRARIRKIPPVARWGILIAALLGFIAPHDYLGLFSAVSYTLYAAIVIMLPFEMPGLIKILDTFVFQWLGRISYSIYLIHVPLLMVLFTIMWGHYSYVTMIFVFIGVLLTAASVFYLVVEAPAMWIGRRLLVKKAA